MAAIKFWWLYTYCLCCLAGLALSSHFRGGGIQWRPATNPYNGNVSSCTYKTETCYKILRFTESSKCILIKVDGFAGAISVPQLSKTFHSEIFINDEAVTNE